MKKLTSLRGEVLGSQNLCVCVFLCFMSFKCTCKYQIYYIYISYMEIYINLHIKEFPSYTKNKTITSRTLRSEPI